MKGRVYKSTGSWYGVKGDDGLFYPSRLRGKFKQSDLKVNNPIAVGDYVTLNFDGEEAGKAVITDIHDRNNYIIRQSTRKTAHVHILASNLDQALLLATLSFPRTSTGFIDRFLVSAEAYAIPAILVFNKKDLMDEKETDKCFELMNMYEALGYTCQLISAQTGEGLVDVKTLLSHKTTLVSGHSGVGKSTLLNALLPHINQTTADVSVFANKGTHTTTFAEMFEGEEDSLIIDTPGIKELGLVEMAPEEISHYFPEMRKHLGECQFHNCLHINEPKCAVKAALKSGSIHESRYKNYCSMLENIDDHR